MTHLRNILRLASVGVMLASCSAPSSKEDPERADADPGRPDARPRVCNQPTLVIGGCNVLPDGSACTGNLDNASFVEIPDGGELPIIVGPQGADMVVFSLRTSDIDPGDLSNPASRDRPDVSILLFRGEDESMGRYSGRPSFVNSTSPTATHEAMGVFLVVEKSIATGETFTAMAEIEDQTGEFRCGTLTFKAADSTSAATPGRSL